MIRHSRRTFLGMSTVLPLSAVAGCTMGEQRMAAMPAPTRTGAMPFGPEPVFPPFEQMYAARSDGGFNIPAVPWKQMDERLLRQVVRDRTGERPGTLMVDTSAHYLYLTLGNGNAIRYGVGLGRAGFEWSGRAEVERKAQWPKWFPPADMIDREPKLERYRPFYNASTGVWDGGMDAGVMNPLGARALYIYQDGRDTLYRLHGNPQWRSIGRSVSSGCVRLLNQDIIDLYTRVPKDTPILVT